MFFWGRILAGILAAIVIVVCAVTLCFIIMMYFLERGIWYDGHLFKRR